jgi:putative ABC transport system permease protein
MFVSVFVVRASQSGGAAILLPLPMVVALFFLTLVMCATAAVVSIKKVTSLDPAMVFRG